MISSRSGESNVFHDQTHCYPEQNFYNSRKREFSSEPPFDKAENKKQKGILQ